MRLARRLAITTRDNHRLRCSKAGGSGDYNQYEIQVWNGSGWDTVGEAKEIHDDIIVTGDQEAIFYPVATADGNHTFRYKIESNR